MNGETATRANQIKNEKIAINEKWKLQMQSLMQNIINKNANHIFHLSLRARVRGGGVDGREKSGRDNVMTFDRPYKSSKVFSYVFFFLCAAVSRSLFLFHFACRSNTFDAYILLLIRAICVFCAIHIFFYRAAKQNKTTRTKTQK